MKRKERKFQTGLGRRQNGEMLKPQSQFDNSQFYDLTGSAMISQTLNYRNEQIAKDILSRSAIFMQTNGHRFFLRQTEQPVYQPYAAMYTHGDFDALSKEVSHEEADILTARIQKMQQNTFDLLYVDNVTMNKDRSIATLEVKQFAKNSFVNTDNENSDKNVRSPLNIDNFKRFAAEFRHYLSKNMPCRRVPTIHVVLCD